MRSLSHALSCCGGVTICEGHTRPAWALSCSVLTGKAAPGNGGRKPAMPRENLAGWSSPLWAQIVLRSLQCAVLSQPGNQKLISHSSPETRQQYQNAWWSSPWPTCQRPGHSKLGHHRYLVFSFRAAHTRTAALDLEGDCHVGLRS